HWQSNVQVEDVDATVAAVKSRDGRIYVEPMDIPKVGRFAVIADPQGATMSVFTPGGPMGLHDSTKHGGFTWKQLLTRDHEAAFRFYSSLCGWERLGEHDMGPMGKYLLYGCGGKQLGGMFTKPKDAPFPAAWLYYVHVDDLDAALAKAKAKGARVMNGPM